VSERYLVETHLSVRCEVECLAYAWRKSDIFVRFRFLFFGVFFEKFRVFSGQKLYRLRYS
jgi:hypothetical protein